MPSDTIVNVLARRPGGAQIAASAVTLGRHAPRAKPVSKRHMMKLAMFVPLAVAMVNRPIQMTERVIIRRRPKRSPSGASKTAPTPRPSNTAERAKPKRAGGMSSAFAIWGNASGIAARS